MSDEQSHGDNANPLSTAAFVRDLVKQAEIKLADLQAKKADIHRRMQRLRYLADNLMASRKASRQSGGSFPESTGQLVSSDRSSALGIGGDEGSQAEASRLPRLNSGKLRRACRIALMESERAQSSSEVYERIGKRGSITFDEYDDPFESLVKELEGMTQNGEILCLPSGQRKLWALKRDESRA